MTRVVRVVFIACVVLTLTSCVRRRRDGLDGGGASATTAPASASPATSSGQRVIGSMERPQGVAIDAESVFWTTSWDAKAIRRMPRGPEGIAPITVCKIDDTSASPEALVVTDTHVTAITSRMGGGGVYRASKTAVNAPCEKVADLATWRERAITAIGNTVYAVGSNDASSATLIAIDPAGKSVKIADLPKPIESMTSDGTSLYLSESWTQRLLKIEVTPGSRPVEIGTAGPRLQFASGRLFYLASNQGVMSLPITGGKAIPVGGGGSGYGPFTIVNDTLYASYKWSVKGSTRLRKASITKPGSTLADHGNESFDLVSGIAGDAREIYVATMRTLVRVEP